MELGEFIENLESELDHVESGTLTPDTVFFEMKEWSSILALIIVAWVSTEFGVHLDDDDILEIRTPKELHERIMQEKVQ